MATALDASPRRRAQHVARSAPARSVPMAGLGPLLLGSAATLLGVWVGIVPYAGPGLGLHLDAAGPWQWSSTHTVLYLVPGAVAFLAGLALASSGLFATTSAGRWIGLAGGAVLVLAGAWLVVGPLAWPVLTSNPAPFVTGSVRHRLLADGAGSVAPGLALVLIGGVSLGWVRRPAPVPAPRSADQPAGAAGGHPEARPFDAFPGPAPLEVPPWPRPSEETSSVGGGPATDAMLDWFNPRDEAPPAAWTPEPDPEGTTSGSEVVDAAAPPEPPPESPSASPTAPPPPPLVDDLPVWGPPEVRFEPEVWSPAGPPQTSTRTENPTATYSTRPGMHRPPPGWQRPDLTEPPRSR